MPTGYGMVQTAVMRLKGLSLQAKGIYSLLASYTGSKDFCFPSVKTIGQDVNLSKPMIIKYIKELETIGLIKISKLYPKDPLKNHNKYEIMFLDEKNDRGITSDTSEVKLTLPRRLNTLNQEGKADFTYNNIIYNNSKTESTPPEGELTPLIEEKTPLRAKNDKISNFLPKNRRNAQNEWFMVPDKMEFEFHDQEHIKLLNKPDAEIIAGLTHIIENDDKREALETDIDIFFRFAMKEKVCKSLINKIKNIDYILDKFDYKQYLKGFELAQKKGKENKLSYLRKILEKAFMPEIYSHMKLKL